MKAIQPRTLDKIAARVTAWVLRIDGDDAISKRLADLGFWPGTKVSVGRRSPFGDPVVYHLRGYRLALRRAEAARVVVTTRPG